MHKYQVQWVDEVDEKPAPFHGRSTYAWLYAKNRFDAIMRLEKFTAEETEEAKKTVAVYKDGVHTYFQIPSYSSAWYEVLLYGY